MSILPRPWSCGCGHPERMHGRDGCAALNGHDEYCICMAVPDAIKLAELGRLLERHRCKTHPRYQAKGRPRGACEGCWRLWIALHP